MMKHQEQEKKPNILFRLLALILTAALLLGAVFLWPTGTGSTWTP